jgi:hypothetical protein
MLLCLPWLDRCNLSCIKSHVLRFATLTYCVCIKQLVSTIIIMPLHWSPKLMQTSMAIILNTEPARYFFPSSRLKLLKVTCSRLLAAKLKIGFEQFFALNNLNIAMKASYICWYAVVFPEVPQDRLLRTLDELPGKPPVRSRLQLPRHRPTWHSPLLLTHRAHHHQAQACLGLEARNPDHRTLRFSNSPVHARSSEAHFPNGR